MAHVGSQDGHGANVVLMGDSGAGKSESLIFCILADEHLRPNRSFDDMGSLQFRDGRVVGVETEIGAFVPPMTYSLICICRGWSGAYS